MITKNGVCYNLEESPYSYEWRGIVYFFSSAPHMMKFKREIIKREAWLDDSLSKRFKCTIHLPILADIQLYTMVETRGFFIQTNDGMEYHTPSSIFVLADMDLIGVNSGKI